MVALDTNVLIRYIVQDDKAQARSAVQLIERECTPDEPGFVNLIVMCEMVWVLKSGYGYSRKVVASVIRAMLTSAELDIEASETVWQALGTFERGKADFADGLIGIHNKKNHAVTTYTFDFNAAQNAEFSLVG